MIRRPPRSTQSRSSAASDVYKRQAPHWANGSDSSQYPPLRDDDYVSFLGFLMRRYGSSVNAYEIWNEPDGEWEWHQPDPARYTALLKKSYTYAKSLNPNVTILAGSLSNVWACLLYTSP